MSNILFNLIKNNVYKDKEIREISFNSTNESVDWIFDFKSQGLSKVFLEEYSKEFWNSFSENEFFDIQVGGMETGAISLVAGVSLLAPESKKVTPFYIRKSRKKSDLANLIEGELVENKPIILVDDILNRGRTTLKSIKILESYGHKVFAVFVCLRFRDISYYDDLLKKGIKVVSIFELNDFINVLPVKNIISEKPNNNTNRYAVDYKVSLTKKPNLYFVEAKSGPVLCGEFIYMASDDGFFYCLKASDGSVVWVNKILFGRKGRYIASTPVIYKGSVLFGAYDGNVYCLNRFSGKYEWVFSDADWVGSPICVDSKGVLYVGLEFGFFKKHGGVVAIDVKTGNVKWKNYDEKWLVLSISIFEKKHQMLFCGASDNCLYALNSKNGKVLWKFETTGLIKSEVAFDGKRMLVIFSSLDGHVYAVHVKSGTLYCKFEARFGFFSAPVIKNNLIVAASLDKYIYCFNLTTKKIEWQLETFGRIFSSPIIDGESIFIGSNDGRLYELNIYNGELISSVQLSERIVNRIQIDHTLDGKKVLYVPTHTCELYKMTEKDN